MLLSIIIPTKDRYTTLFCVVDTILSFNLNDKIEIVVQDNSISNVEALDFIKARSGYDNLKYFYSLEALSVIENSDRAVLNASGEFICFIGDDDGVLPSIIIATEWMRKNGYKALKSYKPNYYWPNQKSNYLSGDVSGVLIYKNWEKELYKVISCQEGLEYTLNRGGNSMEMLPCLYHGIISRDVLDMIYRNTGTFFPGPSPDMANAIALTQVIPSYVYINYPVVISGKSSKSTGGAGVLHKHLARIENVKHLPLDTADKWDQRIPKYWTGPTIWAESALRALKAFGNDRDIAKFNFRYLYAFLFVFLNDSSAEIFKEFKIDKSIGFYRQCLYLLLFRIRIFLRNRLGGGIRRNNISDIGQAVRILSSQEDLNSQV